MTQNTFQPLIIGIIFLIIGLLSLLFYKKKRFLSLVPIAIGSFLILISTIGPLSESTQKVNQIRNLDSIKIARIIIQPTTITTNENISLVKNEVIITDRKVINELCIALHNAVLTDEGFLKTPKSLCRVLIEIKDKKNIIFGMRFNGDDTSLEIDSNGESGWHYAKLKGNEFGQIIKKVCK